MKKIKYLVEIQKRMPDDIIVQDETNFDFTEDECISILCWIKYFKNHYLQNGKNKLPYILFPIISMRMRLDFGLYTTKCDLENNFGKYIIYISPNGQLLNGTIEKKTTLKRSIETWGL